MYGSSGCLGGCARPPTALPEKGPPRKHRRGSKRGVRGQSARSSQDWWTSSSHDPMDNNYSVLNSRSLRKLSNAANFCQDAGPHSSNSNSNNSAFVNHALMLWNDQRRAWVGNRTGDQQPQPQEPREPAISWSTTYEELLGTSRPFPQPVPLPEMVDFLVDVWEQEGLYE